VVIRKKDVEPEEEPERDVEVERHGLLDARAQDLHDHIFAVHARAMHLPEARGRLGRVLEVGK
jgi:hypothetical protein